MYDELYNLKYGRKQPRTTINSELPTLEELKSNYLTCEECELLENEIEVNEEDAKEIEWLLSLKESKKIYRKPREFEPFFETFLSVQLL